MTETDNKEANRLCEDLEFPPDSPRPLCHPTVLWHVVWAPFPKKAKCAKLPRSLAKSLRNRYVTLLCLAWPKSGTSARARWAGDSRPKRLFVQCDEEHLRGRKKSSTRARSSWRPRQPPRGMLSVLSKFYECSKLCHAHRVTQRDRVIVATSRWVELCVTANKISANSPNLILASDIGISIVWKRRL